MSSSRPQSKKGYPYCMLNSILEISLKRFSSFIRLLSTSLRLDLNLSLALQASDFTPSLAILNRPLTIARGYRHSLTTYSAI